MENNLATPVVIHNCYPQSCWDLLRVNGENAGANYLMLHIRHSCRNKGMHVVVYDSNKVKIPVGAVISDCKGPHKNGIVYQHFDSAEDALVRIREICGSNMDHRLWIQEGNIASQYLNV